MGNKQEDYLKQLEDIRRRSRFRKIRGTHRKYKAEGEDNIIGTLLEGKRFLKDKKVDPIETATLAYELMRDGVERGDIKYSLLGAQLYEKIGKGRKTIPRLLKAAEGSLKRYILGDLEGNYSKIKAFIKRNTKERKQKTSGLEKKFGVFAAFIIGGLALGLGSLTITGNAVSNLSQTTPGLLGIFLFIAGLVGMFFYFKGKYR